ncbi:MAG: hypothetical protein AAGG08_11130, partial [Actinomycetota bacterium]
RFVLSGLEPKLGSLSGFHRATADGSRPAEMRPILANADGDVVQYVDDSDGATAIDGVIATPDGFDADVVGVDIPNTGGAAPTIDELIAIDRDAGGVPGRTLLWWPGELGDDPVDISASVTAPIDITKVGDHLGILVDEQLTDGEDTADGVVWLDETGTRTGSVIVGEADSIAVRSNSQINVFDWTPDAPDGGGTAWRLTVDPTTDAGVTTRTDVRVIELAPGRDLSTVEVTNGSDDLFTIDRASVTLEAVCLSYAGGDATTVSEVGCTPETALVGFADVDAIAADATNGDFVILNAGRLLRFDPTGRATSSVDVRIGGEERSLDVAVRDSDGLVCVTNLRFDLQNGSSTPLLCFDRQLEPVFSESVPDIGLAIEFDDDGEMWILGRTVLRRYVERPDCFGQGGLAQVGWCLDVEIPGEFRDVASGGGFVYATDIETDRVFRFGLDGTPGGWIGACSGEVDCAEDVTTGWTDAATPAGAGDGLGQFTFRAGGAGGALDFSDDGRIDVDDLGTIFVSDHVESFARVQAFSPQGTWVDVAQPDSVLDDGLLSFLDMGDFTGVNDIAVLGDEFFLAEGSPLQRVHVYDVVGVTEPSEFDPSATVTYIAPASSGPDSFRVSVRDPFTAPGEATQATVTIDVVETFDPPVITCPPNLQVTARSAAGIAQQADAPLNRFIRGATATSRASGVTVLPAPAIADDAPAVYPIGSTTVTFIATDAQGRATSCTATVEVIDAPPVAERPVEAVIEATGPTTDLAVVLTPPTGSDPVLGQPVQVTLTAPVDTAVEPGEHLAEWTATNARGTSTVVRQRVVVADTTAPAFSDFEPTSPVTATTGSGTALGFTLPTATDAVGDPSVTCIPSPTTPVGVGTTLVECFATDPAGNTASTEANIEVDAPDGDGDGISDMNDEGDGFSDIPLGGTTTGTVETSTSPQLRDGAQEIATLATGSFVFDAPSSESGVIVIGQSPPVAISLCNGRLVVQDLGEDEQAILT